MRVRVRYFASVREALGAGETVEVDGTATLADVTVANVRDALIARDDAHAAALGRHRLLRSALDQTLCAESAPVGDNAEVAFFPPLTGG